jgi:predicted ATPase
MSENNQVTVLNNRYELGDELGRGGMGVVYRAHDSVLDREVAVKILNDSGLGTEGRARLLGEAQAVAKLNHPNIVTVHDAGELDGTPYIVMELVEGKSLHDQPSDGFESMLAMARDVSAALEHAHANDIIHRDLKPENVIIAPDGTAKLMDFGLARSIATRMSVEGEIVGTVFYIAPETAMGQHVDGRADLYSLGVILYEQAAGELPFIHEDPLAVVSQHIHATVLPPRAKNPEIPPVFEELILQLLSKDPDDRHKSAAALLNLLENPDLLDPDAETEKELSVIARIARGRFVARQSELEQAKGVWSKALGGQGETLLISGEPGIGKTRLVRELSTHVELSGGRVLIGECYAEGGAPYAPFAQIARGGLSGISQNGFEVSDFVMADLLSMAPELQPHYPDVLPNLPLEPNAEQQRLFENVVSFTDVIAEHSPLMIVIDDAHWGDSGSLSMLRHLARRTRNQRILLVATYREVDLDIARPFHEVLLDINKARLATRIKLERLTKDQTRDQLTAIFEEEISQEFLDGIYKETEGNPFFVEEVCKSLVESGQLYYDEGEWHRPPNMDELEIPQSVRVAIQTRVARLPDAYQGVLSMAAILGREFEFDALVEASDADEDAVIDALEAAEDAQLIEETGGADEDRFVFVHALIPGALLDGVRKLRRRKLHKRAAAAIKQLRPNDYEALAHHYFEAGVDDQAFEYFTRAGERAAAAYANAEAEDHFSSALDLVEEDVERARLLGQFATAVSQQGRFDLAIENYLEGIVLYQGLGEQEMVAKYFARAARAAWEAGDIPRGLELGLQGLESLEGAPDSQGLAELYAETGRAYYFNAQGAEAEPTLTKALEMAEQTSALNVRIEALITLGTLQASEGGDAETGVANLKEAVTLAKENSFPRQEARAQNNLATTETHALGDLSLCRDRMVRAEELARTTGSLGIGLWYAGSACFYAVLQGDLKWVRERMPRLLAAGDELSSAVTARLNVQAIYGILLRQAGELDEGLEYLRKLHSETLAAGESNTIYSTAVYFADAALEVGRHVDEALEMIDAARKTNQFGGPVWPLAQQARLHTALGQYDDARQSLKLARKEAGDPPFGLSSVWLGIAEAELALRDGETDSALRAYEQTVEAAGIAGLRWHRTHALWSWAEALIKEDGKLSSKAQELLEEARQEFDELGAPIYAERMAVRLTDLGGGKN